MKPLSVLLLSIGLAIAFCFSIEAQRKSAASAPPTFSIKELNIDVPALPSGFLGNSLKLVHSILNQRGEEMQKGEFETSEQFISRKAATLKKPIIGNMTLDSRFAFLLEDTKAAYDADARNLHLTISTDDSHVRTATALPLADRQLTIIAASETVSDGSYIAENAFGASRRVQRLTRAKWCLEVPGDALMDAASVDFEVGQIEAPHYKQSLRFLVIGKLRPPYANEGREIIKPTINDPVELLTFDKSLYVKPEAWWLFDITNGRIIHKQSLAHKTSEVAADPVGTPLPDWAVTVYRAPGSPFYHYSETCSLITTAAKPLSLAEAKQLAHSCDKCSPIAKAK